MGMVVWICCRMLKISQLKLPVQHTKRDIENKIIKDLRLRSVFQGEIPVYTYKILRRSIDARRKPDIFYVYNISVDFKSEKLEKQILSRCKNDNVSVYVKNEYQLPEMGNTELKHSPIIVGEGPAGLFSGLLLARKGYKPIIIERGSNVQKRVKIVEDFWTSGQINEKCNVQFGEGGAGTFSDGKLNTVVKDPSGKNQFVLDTFVEFGAKKEVSFDAKPHVGTDALLNVVEGIRKEIIKLGGRVLFDCLVTDLVINDNRIKGVIVDNYSDTDYILEEGYTVNRGVSEIASDIVILAVGHSARDTFRMLKLHDVEMTQKNFAVGLRVQHPQKMIDDIQYGLNHSDVLPPADYKLTNKASNGKSVYSFCMCPGGFVVNASSFNGMTAINGMSYSERSAENANSALIVNVDKTDFDSDDVFAGLEFQEKLEKKAYEIGKGKIPVQCYGDYKSDKATISFDGVNPAFKGEFMFANLRELFSDCINDAIIESMSKFGYTMKGFDRDDAIFAGIESRTSSPVRIVRDESFESNIKGLYPCGEGAGYAGGITSACIDGIKIAEAIIMKYKNIES